MAAQSDDELLESVQAILACLCDGEKKDDDSVLTDEQACLLAEFGIELVVRKSAIANRAAKGGPASVRRR